MGKECTAGMKRGKMIINVPACKYIQENEMKRMYMEIGRRLSGGNYGRVIKFGT